MSVLNRFRRASQNRHLDEAALTEIWSASVEGVQPSSDSHLAVCQLCRTRYEELTAWLENVRDVARAEADEAFPAERLAAQQAQVLRRLEALERPARVIAFPKFARPVTTTQSHAQRWIAAAAAAGLVIGLAAGQFVDIRDVLRGGRLKPQTVQTRAIQSPVASNPAVSPAGASVSDEMIFFGDNAPGVRFATLQPMDDITPRARDAR